MRRDYADSSSQPKKNKKQPKKAAPKSPVKWLVVGVLLGVSIAILIYIQMAGTFLPKVKIPTASSTSSVKSPSESDPFPAVKNNQENEYEFWELLKNKTVKIPEDPADIDPKDTKKYIMQCGSFRKAEMAETLKAQIALAGFESMVKATGEKDKNTWYRVVLGPYQGKRSAETIRHRLRENNILGCQIW